MSSVINLLDASDDDDEEVILLPSPQKKKPRREPAVVDLDSESKSHGIEDDPYESLHARLLNFFPGLSTLAFQRMRAQHDRLVSAGTALPEDFENFAISTMANGASSSSAAEEFSARGVISRLRPMFPRVDTEYARGLINKARLADPVLTMAGCVHIIALKLSEEKNYKKVEEPKKLVLPERDFQTWKDPEVLNRWKKPDVYKEEASLLLANAFQRVPMRVIKRFMKDRNWFYYPTKLWLEQKMDSTQLLARRRSLRYIEVTHVELVREREWEKSYERSEKEKADAEAAVKLHDERAAKESTTIECGCCYTDRAFENMIQCTDGHLFCRDCLKHYAQERLFGSGATGLKCMDTAGCTGKFVRTQLERALPKKVLEKWEEAEARECVEKLKKSAGLTGLFTCPHCDSVADVPETMQVVVCPNEACGKETCKKCRRESHIPLRCEEVVEEEETAGRISIEEKMTEMRLRTCPNCSTRFFKTEGCNRRCGTSMCYVCRKANVSYNHFVGKCAHHADTIRQDMKAVIAAGEKAKEELLGKMGEHAKKKLEKLDIAELGKETRTKRQPYRLGLGPAPGPMPGLGLGVGLGLGGGRAAAMARRAGGGADIHGLGLRRMILQQLAGMAPGPRGMPTPAMNVYAPVRRKRRRTSGYADIAGGGGGGYRGGGYRGGGGGYGGPRGPVGYRGGRVVGGSSSGKGGMKRE